MTSSQSTHCVAVIGGATAGAEVAGRLAAQGAEVVVFDQNPRPYGKVEDGLDILDEIASIPCEFGPGGEQSQPTERVEIQRVELRPDLAPLEPPRIHPTQRLQGRVRVRLGAPEDVLRRLDHGFSIREVLVGRDEGAAQ